MIIAWVQCKRLNLLTLFQHILSQEPNPLVNSHIPVLLILNVYQVPFLCPRMIYFYLNIDVYNTYRWIDIDINMYTSLSLVLSVSLVITISLHRLTITIVNHSDPFLLSP